MFATMAVHADRRDPFYDFLKKAVLEAEESSPVLA
jgi:hypothetical protein